MTYACGTVTGGKTRGLGRMALSVTIWTALAHRPELDDIVVLTQDLVNTRCDPVNCVR